MISKTELIARLKKVALLCLDVDGVLTDGGLYYTENGDFMKKFNVKDGFGMNRIAEIGVQIAIISASHSKTVAPRAAYLKIPHVITKTKDKKAEVMELCKKLKLDLQQVAYMGDDLNDVEAMKVVGCPMTVADAMQANKAVACFITERAGGQGAVREVCDLIYEAKS